MSEDYIILKRYKITIKAYKREHKSIFKYLKTVCRIIMNCGQWHVENVLIEEEK